MSCIASAVSKTPAAVRQIAHRDREHLAARRPRVQVSRAEQEAVVERFLAAVRGGDLQGLLDVLAPDVVVVSDGGGVVAAVRRPLVGAERAAAFLVGASRTVDFEATGVWINGSWGSRIDIAGTLDTIVSITVESGRVTRVYAIRNPSKLAHLDDVAALTRT